jgi:diguanylate cyclase (GGDEF)-like protein/PAS domain S-box-containing protein
MQDLINSIKADNQFDIYIVDSDGYFLVNADSKYSWSRYLNKDINIHTQFPSITKDILKTYSDVDNIYLYPLEKQFRNSENIVLVLKTKDEFINELYDNNIDYAIYLGVLVLIVSLPLGFFVSIPASNIENKLKRLYKENSRYIETIDKYVVTSTVTTDKKIDSVSTALCEVSGYNKEDVIGENPNIFKSGQMSREVYKDLWEKITNGLVWKGELQNLTKEGEYYWLNMTILPNIEDGEIISYTSIAENITDKKLIEKISQQDKLTQLYNRIKLDKTLEDEMHRYNRYKESFSIIMVDIDYFKAVNDEYGHQVGDSVLKEVATLLKINTREVDIVGRWGGEEFMIILPKTSIDGAMKLAEKLRVEIAGYEFGVVGHKSASFGVGEYTDSDNINTLIKRVDDNLYKAKHTGRDRVVG